VSKITVLIVDDHQIFRQGLRDSLTFDEGIEIVGEAPNGEVALELAAQLRPQVVITDVNLPGTYTIILTAYDDEEQLFHAVRAGAHGFFSKDVSPQRILVAVRDIVDGKYVMGPKVMEEEEVVPWVIKASERYAPTFGDEVQEAFVPLSPREMEIVQYITRGLSNKLIAHKLGISHQTVKNHMTSILRKLDVEDRTQAAIYAIRHGWVRLQDTQSPPPRDDVK
jgi:DNA-binding NarL/FixJ family response regulator